MKKAFLLSLVSVLLFAGSLAAQTTENKKARPDLPGHLLWDMGFNQVLNSPTNMGLKFFGSRSNSFSYLYTLKLGSSGFTFNPGIGVGIDKYAFKSAVSFMLNVSDTTKALHSTVIYKLDTTKFINADKSLFSTTYLEVPVEFRYYTNKSDDRRGFNFAIGGKFGYKMDSMTKIRYSEFGEKRTMKNKQDFNLNPIRFGIYGRVGIGGFNLWYYHSLTPLFGELGPDKNINSTPIRFGASFEIF